MRAICTLAANLALAIAAVVLGGCASSPRSPEPSTERASPPEVTGRLNLEQANDVTLYAISLVGTPYRFGGNTPESGFDCSGLIGHVYRARAAVATPRTVAQLADWGQAVTPQAVRTGDLVVFTQNRVASHAGIYVGDGRFVHAPSTGGEVRLEALNARHWSKMLISYRRP
jgi:cell wall-associated NlpC family hydrolase